MKNQKKTLLNCCLAIGCCSFSCSHLTGSLERVINKHVQENGIAAVWRSAEATLSINCYGDFILNDPDINLLQKGNKYARIKGSIQNISGKIFKVKAIFDVEFKDFSPPTWSAEKSEFQMTLSHESWSTPSIQSCR